MSRWLTTGEIIGMDLEWFACDSLGYLGYFSLCMVSRVPVSVASDAAALEQVADYFERLPKSSQAVPVVEVDWESQDDWIRAAERGFFAYDGSSGAPPLYRMLVAPERPMRISDLEPRIAEIIGRTKATIDFSSHREIYDDSVFGPWTRGRQE